jgi:hypothetical protein
MTQLETLLSESRKAKATEVANEAAMPIIRSMYPSRSRGQMANEFRHFFLLGAEFEAKRLENIIRVAVDALTTAEINTRNDCVERLDNGRFIHCNQCKENNSDFNIALAEMERIAGEVK